MEDYSGFTNSDEREILSVTELNKTVNDFMNEAFPPLWVVGEISNFKEYGSSGHWYFSIKDSESILNCSMFRLQNINLGFKPNEGDQVILQGKLSVWHKTGRYQMIVNKMELAGYGELLRKFELLKNKLNSEGLFQIKTEEQVPQIINKVAILTSSHGAAVRDVISTLQRKAPHIEATILPTAVQGESSVNSIKKSLEDVEKLQQKYSYDALIICRGGGSIEDLWSFNDESLCRHVAQMSIPVISGIGHETDFTLMDFVANIRAATPTAAAEITSNGASQLKNHFANTFNELIKVFKMQINKLKERVELNKKLLRSPQQKVYDQYQKLDQKSEQLSFVVRNILEKNIGKFNFVFSSLNARNPNKSIQQFSKELENTRIIICRIFKNNITRRSLHISSLNEQLTNLNPSNILERGYSITYNANGKIVKDIRSIKKGDKISTQLKSGKIESKVT